MKKEIKTSTGLLIIFAAAVIIFGGCYTYANIIMPQPDYTVNLTPNVVKKTDTATKDWKTYTNDTYGFSFKYPKEWKISSTFVGHVVALEGSVKSETAAFAVDHYNAIKDLKYVDGTNDGSSVNATSLIGYFNSQKLEYKAIKINGFDAYQATNYPNIGGINYYFLENKGQVYLINFDSVNQLEVDKLLSTFQFTTPNPTAGWQTYTNSTYKFSLKYPKDMTYEVSDTGKNIVFQTSDDKSSYEDCLKVQQVECIKPAQLAVNIDESVGASADGDNIDSTLDQIIQNRVTNASIVKDPQKITLGDQPAYDTIGVGMFSSYTIVSKSNNHMYDLVIVQNCKGDIATLESCKVDETDLQKTMLSTFQFTK